MTTSRTPLLGLVFWNVVVALSCAGPTLAVTPAGPTAEPKVCATATPACRAVLPIEGKGMVYYRTHDLAVPDPAITRAVVVIHGNSRKVERYFTSMAGAAQVQGVADNTVVIAPYFQTDPDRSCAGRTDSPRPNELFWSCEGWKEGHKAVNSDSVYSYSVMDAVLAVLGRSFSNLAHVTVTGFSAGGQLVQRYAVGTQVDGTLGFPVRYVVGSPSSYLYLDDQRLKLDVPCPDPEHCPLTAASFEPAYYQRAACPNFDDYKYGLLHRQGYLAAVRAADLRRQYPARDVTYLLGELDAGPSKVALFSELDKTCAADAQGPLEGSGRNRHSYRKQRGLTYHAYINAVLGGHHSVRVVPGCGHSEDCVYSSPAGREEVFR